MTATNVSLAAAVLPDVAPRAPVGTGRPGRDHRLGETEPPASAGDSLSAEGRREAPQADTDAASDRSRRADGKEPRGSFKEAVKKAMAKDEQTDRPDEATTPDEATPTDAPQAGDAKTSQVSSAPAEGAEQAKAAVVPAGLAETAGEVTEPNAGTATERVPGVGLPSAASVAEATPSALAETGVVAAPAKVASGETSKAVGSLADAMGRPVAAQSGKAGESSTTGDAQATGVTTGGGASASASQASLAEGRVPQAVVPVAGEDAEVASSGSGPAPVGKDGGEGVQTTATKPAGTEAGKADPEAGGEQAGVSGEKIASTLPSAAAPERSPRVWQRPAEAVTAVGGDDSSREAQVRSDTGQARGELAGEQGAEVRVVRSESAGAGEAFSQRLDSAMSEQSSAESAGTGASSPTATVGSVSSPTSQAAPARADAPPMADQVIETLRMASRRVGDQVTIRLNPPELGRVRVQLDRDGAGLRGVIRVESAETMRELQREAADLMQRLSTDGVQVRRIEVVLETHDASRDGQESTGRQGGEAGFFGGDGEASGSAGQGGPDGRESPAASSDDGAWTDEASYGLDDEVVADESIDVAV